MRSTITDSHAPPPLLCWTGVTLGTLWFVCFLPAWCPAVLGLLSATQKSIQSPRYRMMCVAHNHWHSFLQSVHSAAPHYMLAGLYVYHGRGRPLHWCQSYNGRCEIWTDTVRLQSSLLLFPFGTSPSETHRHCFSRLLRLNFCAHIWIFCLLPVFYGLLVSKQLLVHLIILYRPEETMIRVTSGLIKEIGVNS